jgi:glycosyltransferase involved in cell wall biosynthesis
MGGHPPLVSVIVPAYNAGLTLDETLLSIRAQTHSHLEIIVVDDGSTDDTATIAARHASEDERVRVVTQANAGVAAARNLGLQMSRGDFIAPIDADDLWSPQKIAKQVAAFEKSGTATIVYTPHAVIDPAGRITGYGHKPIDAVQDLRAMCRRNIVGNGSAALMRRADVVALGGYDPTLRERQAQGCEDYKLYLALAARGPVVAVPEFLTGYRYTPTNMSSDVLQMERSHEIVLDEFVERHPALAADVRAGRRRGLRWLIARAMRAGDWDASWTLFRKMLVRDLAGAAAVAAGLPVRAVRRVGLKIGRRLGIRRRDAPPGERFPIGSIGV